MYKKFFKRFFDILLSLLLLIISSPIMLITAICIKIESEGPVLYNSKRMGKNLKPFKVYKFRSMVNNRKELDGKLTHEQMVTKVGKFIRKTSIDELPQLFNILKGEMSFIGPRPWILEYYEVFSEEQKRRCDVLPGITGLAQAKGRNGISIFKKIEYDIEYVDNISFKMDIQVIWWTIKTVLSEDNAEISEAGIKEEIEHLRCSNEKPVLDNAEAKA